PGHFCDYIPGFQGSCSPCHAQSTCPVNTERLQDYTVETGTRQRSVPPSLPNSVTVGKTFLPNKPSSTTNMTILFPLAVRVQVQTHMLAHSINC
ncbi:hypothetical protein AMECASPLE_016543, partial [Ameca splendens]